MTTPFPLTSSVAVPCGAGVMLLLEPPEGWVMAPPNPPAQLILLDPLAPGPFRPNINLVVQDLGRMTTEEFLTLSRLQMKGLGDKAALVTDAPMSGLASHLFEFLAYN